MRAKLYRSVDDKMIGGVCGGLGEYFEIDSTLIRILFLALLFFGGTGLLIYLVCWIIIPLKPVFKTYYSSEPNKSAETYEVKDTPKEPTTQLGIEPSDTYNKTKTFWGIIAIVIGTLLLLDNFDLNIGFSKLWPIVLIILGAYLILKSKN